VKLALLNGGRQMHAPDLRLSPPAQQFLGCRPHVQDLKEQLRHAIRQELLCCGWHAEV
jgi:hypothetical protein